MNNKKTIDNAIKNLKNLQNLVGAYEEIAANRTRKAKASVIKNRESFEGLNSIFEQVKISYRDEIQKFIKSRQRKRWKTVVKIRSPKKKKAVAVLLSSNTGLYGDIIKETFDKFINTIKNRKTDVVIVGKMGLSQYLNQGLKKNYKYFHLSDGVWNPEEVAKIFKYINDYNEVSVFHGRYENILKQVPIEDPIAGTPIKLGRSQKESKGQKYLFEPSLEEVLKFFETQMKSFIFDQMLFESNLSKYASRMINLYFANENIKKRLSFYKFLSLRMKHRLLNKKQLEKVAVLNIQT